MLVCELIGKDKFHKSHYFERYNTVPFQYGDDKVGIGGDKLPGQRIEAPTSKYPSGIGKQLPTWLAFEKQVRLQLVGKIRPYCLMIFTCLTGWTAAKDSDEN
ncbi:hypothetical protein X801_07604 [Opisthorchis viverrini]|uniref:Uncharacterized protein n=1 Tax=Opisthorchis viverrini TaxID=6198 RepID=A0A1S8WQ31_OPIVI|nr:hypothetical protein X801_07604 [Opisthorchis viverrini]